MGVTIAGALVLSVLIVVLALGTRSRLVANIIQSISSSAAVDRTGEQARTELTMLSADISGTTLTLEVKNTGLTSIYDYTGMDFIVDYTDTAGTEVFTYLAYTTDTLASNQWQKTSLFPDSFQPNGWNPDETITLDALLSIAQKDDTVGTVTLAAPNGELASSPFSTKGFFWFTTAYDISLTTTASWQDIDLSPYVPAGATGAIIEVVNTGTTNAISGVVRGKEDTRNYMSNLSFEEIEEESHRWQIVKVDSNVLIQGYIENTEIDFKLRGYTSGSDPSYFDTPADITPSTTAQWVTIDVSAFVDTDTDGVILLVDSQDAAKKKYGIREADSGFPDPSTDQQMSIYANTMYLVGIDGADQFDLWIETTNLKIYLVGQTKGSVVYYSTDIAVGDPTLGSWQELDADDSSIPAEANGLIFRVEKTGAGNSKAGFRHGDSTDDWNGDLESSTHLQAATGLRSDNVWDEYLEDANLNVSIAAYTKPLTN